MAQNIYDDPDFLAGYARLPRQTLGLEGAPEWPATQALLPPMSGRRVGDLGCGFGWFSRWAAEEGAESVAGFDISEAMIDRASTDTGATFDERVGYRRADLESIDLGTAEFDLVYSSLTLHYIEDLARLMSTISSSVRPGGHLVYSVEHPLLSAPTSQAFQTGADGHTIWPLDNYLIEGERERSWFVDGVRKQHRTVASWVNTTIHAGFQIDELIEWGPSADQITENPKWAIDLHRPWFLLVRASKP